MCLRDGQSHSSREPQTASFLSFQSKPVIGTSPFRKVSQKAVQTPWEGNKSLDLFTCEAEEAWRDLTFGACWFVCYHRIHFPAFRKTTAMLSFRGSSTLCSLRDCPLSWTVGTGNRLYACPSSSLPPSGLAQCGIPHFSKHKALQAGWKQRCQLLPMVQPCQTSGSLGIPGDTSPSDPNQ